MQPFGQLLQSFDDARPRTINQVGSDPDYSIRPDGGSRGEIAPQIGLPDQLGAVDARATITSGARATTVSRENCG